MIKTFAAKIWKLRTIMQQQVRAHCAWQEITSNALHSMARQQVRCTVVSKHEGKKGALWGQTLPFMRSGRERNFPAWHLSGWLDPTEEVGMAHIPVD
ncbi:hypothetical protein AVEN_79632-1 [Araneus ventricosus]|uniref:Uncharacterized protein n=1 Tax=Araneus ventricosus TaxID=182803 RepID=A0A4Y2G1K7_ARAVE|nr:hypothetical protein AVEN_79632-1 [Araneus ventricosus]